MNRESRKYGRSSHNIPSSCWWAWTTLGVLALACFAFFQWAYPYHLHHREQVMLYQGAGNLLSFGGVGVWLSQWLTQYFYYRVAGPLIVTAVMALVWIGAWLLTLRATNRMWIAVAVASAMMTWQTLCQTTHLATLQPALAWGAALLTLGLLWRRRIGAALCAAAVLWLIGNPFGGRLWAWPDMAVERRMAIDSEAYFGNWDEVLRLCQENTTEQTEVFYYNLANAVGGTLPDNLLKHKQIGTEGLLPSLGTHSDYLMMNALGEAWYHIGAIADAEHCAMLGLVFSPNSTGSRYIRRLAQVNLANGEQAVADKYLRMLMSSPVHRRWAQRQGGVLAAELAALQSLQLQGDNLHLANDIVSVLRHMLYDNTGAGDNPGSLDISGDAKASPRNRMAYDYLLCLHLVNRNLEGFLQDYNPQMPRSTLYDEALILALLQKGATPQQAMAYNIHPDVLCQFQQYIALEHPSEDEFGTTYWYYYNYL